MPLPAAAIAAYTALVNALPSAAPVLGAAVVSFGIIASHQPGLPDTVQLKGEPELAAECIKRNVASLNSKLVAVVQPLHGIEMVAVVLKKGIVGDPLMSVIIEQGLSGSRAELRSIEQPDQDPAVITKMMAGC
jgi:hypothetical protein